MATTPQSVTTRTVVLLRPSERKRLEKLAAAESVSSGEILRRSLHAYEQQMSEPEQTALAALLKEMNSSLDHALASARASRKEIAHNLDLVKKRRKQHA